MRWLRLHWQGCSTRMWHIRKRVSVEEGTRLKIRPILTRETNCLHDLRVKGLSDLFKIRLQNDDVQDFDVRWDKAPLSASEIPTEMVLEGLFKSKITAFCSASDCLGFVRPGSCQKQWTTELFKAEDTGETSSWSNDENSKPQSLERSCWERSSDHGSKKKESLRWEESRRVFSVESTWRMFERRLLLFQSCIGHWKQLRDSQTKWTIVLTRTKFEGQDWRRGRKTLKDSGNRYESSSDNRGKISCRYSNCSNPSCNYWHPPVCQNYKSQTGCKYGNKCYFRQCEAGEKPSKKSKKGGAKGSVA